MHANGAAGLPVDEASTLPGAVYHDRAFFDLERTNVWQSSWVAAAELADVADADRSETDAADAGMSDGGGNFLGKLGQGLGLGKASMAWGL